MHALYLVIIGLILVAASTLGDGLNANPQPPCLPNHFVVHDQALLNADERNHVWSNGEFGERWLKSSKGGEQHVVTAQVSSVPCAQYTCCNMLFSFRPNTTDKGVFDTVRCVQKAIWHQTPWYRFSCTTNSKQCWSASRASASNKSWYA